MVWRWKKRRRIPDRTVLGDLTMWEVPGEDGEEYAIWAEMSPDPKMAPAVERVKQTMRDQGWRQTAGD